MRWNGVVRATVCATVAASAALTQCGAEELTRAPLVGDAIPRPLTDEKGDAARGRAIVANRQVGLCLLCHTAPIPEERLQGNLAPSLAGAGSRWTEGQLRLRIVNARHLNPSTIMPPYFRTEDLERVAPNFRGKPILTAGQIEDVVAYVMTLKE